MRKDLVGQRVGRLTVLEPTELRDPRKPMVIWRCRCDCGNEAFERTDFLTKRLAQSCGCLQDENRRLDITGQKRGRLTAIKDTGERQNGASVWLWRCDCGNTCLATPSQVSALSGKVQCPECTKKLKAQQINNGRQNIQRDENGTMIAVKEAILAGKPTSNNTSGVRGVSWHKGEQKWVARIFLDGKVKTIGYYDNLEDAAAARMKAVHEKYGYPDTNGDHNPNVEDHEETQE